MSSLASCLVGYDFPWESVLNEYGLPHLPGVLHCLLFWDTFSLDFRSSPNQGFWARTRYPYFIGFQFQALEGVLLHLMLHEGDGKHYHEAMLDNVADGDTGFSWSNNGAISLCRESEGEVDKNKDPGTFSLFFLYQSLVTTPAILI